MKTILVPTDFSVAADYAVHYAIKLARKFEAAIILYHSFIPFESGFYPEKQSKKENNLHEKNLVKRLTLVKKKLLQLESKSVVRIYVDRGPEGIRLIEFCQKKKIDLIVMGTKGASGLQGILIGSFTAHIMSKAPCPVLAIPLKYNFKVPKKIVYASDYRKNETKAIQLLATWSQLFQSRISILHIENKDSGAMSSSSKSFIGYKQRILKLFKATPITFHRKLGNNIPQSILKSASKNNTDILAMSPIKRDGYWDRLFHKSVTKSTAHKIEVPLLTIPLRDAGKF